MLAVLGLCLAPCGCSCYNDATLADRGSVLSLSARTIDFGVVQVGSSSRTVLTIASTAGTPLEIAVGIAPPFGGGVERLKLRGGEAHSLELLFEPVSVGAVERTLRLRGDEVHEVVVLRGVGAEPCGESSECSSFTTDATTGRCVEATALDGMRCDGGPCLGDAHCSSGRCRGSAVVCDDGNPCTADVCDSERGCVALEDREACPQPSDPCEVSICDPQLGCVIAQAVDGTSCGSRGCDSVAVCLQGRCQRVEAPAEQRVEQVWHVLDSDEASSGHAQVLGTSAGQTLVGAAHYDFLLDSYAALSISMAGEVRWTLQGQSFAQTTAAVNGKLVALGGLDAYAATDGRLLWSHGSRLDGATPERATGHGSRLFVSYYLDSESSLLEVIDASSGTVEREIPINGGGIRRLFVDELGHPLIEVGHYLGRAMRRLDADTGELIELPMGEGFEGLYALYGGVFVGRDSRSLPPHFEVRFAIFERGKRLASGPWARRPPVDQSASHRVGAPVLIDSESVWMVASAPGCEPAPDRSCAAASHLYRYDWSGSLRWVSALDGELALGPILTEAGTALLAVHPPDGYAEQTTEIIEIDGSGRPLLRCPLPLRLRGYLTSEVLLDELLVATEVHFVGQTSRQRYSLRGIRVPGARVAPRGWVSRTGSFDRPLAPRPLTR